MSQSDRAVAVVATDAIEASRQIVRIFAVNAPIAVVTFFDIQTFITELAPAGEIAVNTIFCLHAISKIITVLRSAKLKTQITIFAIINIVTVWAVLDIAAIYVNPRRLRH